MTLLSGIDADATDAARRLERLSARIRPFTLRLGRLDVSFEAAAVDLVDTSREIPVERWHTLAARAFTVR